MLTIKKPIGDIAAADVHALVSDSWPESELLEFKETLATNSSGVADRWLTDQSDIGQSAKHAILAEVVAMANSYGGDVVLGVRETKEKPPRAEKIVEQPKCIELAHRLELAARDLIKPEIPMLSVRGIEITGQSGVVLFRVPRSRLAPHRLEMKSHGKECYKRVGARTEPMTMREIQDLTFSVARGLGAIDAGFQDLHTEFLEWSGLRGGLSVRRRGLRASAIPLSADLRLDPVHNVQRVRPISRSFKAKLNTHDVEFFVIGDPYDWRPILRGTQALQKHSNSERLLRLTTEGVLTDEWYLDAPLTDSPGTRSEHVLFPEWFFGMVCCAFASIDRFRTAASASGVSYALELAIGATAPLPVMRLNSRWHDPAGTLPTGVRLFPRYEVGEQDSWSETMTVIWRDFWSSIGIDAYKDVLEVTW